MCGRSSNTASKSRLVEKFRARFRGEAASQWTPLFNIAPTHPYPVITSDDRAHIQMAHWGFRLRFRNQQGGHSQKTLFNARGETLSALKSFRPAWAKGQRCLFLSTGFFEWMHTTVGKIPFRIGLRGGEPFAIGGLWQRRSQETPPLEATLITTRPNQLLKLIHNKTPGKERMPFIVPENQWAAWLSPDTSLEAAQAAIEPFPDAQMQAYPLSSELSRSYKNQPELIAPREGSFPEWQVLQKAAAQNRFDLVPFD